jgi:hypothetical protein
VIATSLITIGVGVLIVLGVIALILVIFGRRRL